MGAASSLKNFQVIGFKCLKKLNDSVAWHTGTGINSSTCIMSIWSAWPPKISWKLCPQSSFSFSACNTSSSVWTLVSFRFWCHDPIDSHKYYISNILNHQSCVHAPLLPNIHSFGVHQLKNKEGFTYRAILRANK